MISTGSPDASLPATCGSDPTGLTPPFGGRQGTRLKISPADFATSLTFSIALAVRLFCCDGLAGSTAATLPVPTVWDVAAGSGLALSASAACWAGWAACARAGNIDPGASRRSTAMTGTAIAVVRQKRRTLINAGSSVLLGRAEVSGVEDKFRERTADTIMNALRKLDAVRRAKKVEISGVVPLTHDGETVEQRDVVLLCDQAHIIQIGRHGNHRFRARAILRVHQDHV